MSETETATAAGGRDRIPRQRRALLLLALAAALATAVRPVHAGLFSRSRHADDNGPPSSRGRARQTETAASAAPTYRHDDDAATGTVTAKSRPLPDTRSADAGPRTPDARSDGPSAAAAAASDDSTAVVGTGDTDDEPADAPCDGYLAKSLVRANERMDRARTERDEAIASMKHWQTLARNAEEELAKTQKVVGAQLLELEKELDRTEQAAAKNLAKSVRDADKTREELQQQHRQQIDAQQATHQTAIQKLTRQIEQAEVDADRRIASLEQRHEHALRDIRAQHQADIDAKDADIANLKKTHQQALVDMTEQHGRDLATKDSSSAALQQAHEEHILALKDSHAKELKRKDDAIAALKDSHAEQLDKKQAEINSSLADHRQVIQQLQSAHATALEQKDADLAALQQQHNNTIATLNDKHAKAVQLKQNEMERLRANHTAVVADLKNATARQIEELNATHDKQIAAMKDAMQKDAQNAKADKDSALASLTQDFEAYKKQAGQETRELQTKLRDLEKEHNKLQRVRRLLEGSLKQSHNDLKEWEAKHANRSYCNVTHISEDAVNVVYKASETAATKLKSAAAEAQKQAKVAYDRTLATASPRIESSRKIIKDSVEPHYNAYVKPHYDAYVAPVVDRAVVLGEQYHREYTNPALEKLRRKFVEMWNIFKSKSAQTFDYLVGSFAEQCPVALSDTKKFARKHEVQLPHSMLARWDQVCRSPRQSLVTFLRIAVIILLLIFRNPILRCIWWILCLPFRVMMYPFRLCFGRSKRKNATTATNGGSKADGSTKRQTQKLMNGATPATVTNANGSVRVKKRVAVKKLSAQ